MSRRHIKSKNNGLMTAFIITIVIAVLAFYYVWEHSAGYGRTLEGLQSFACSQYLRENPEAEVCPQFTLIQTEKQQCCCQTKGGYALETFVDVPKDSSEYEATSTCLNTCETRFKATGMGLGRCGQYGVDYPG